MEGAGFMDLGGQFLNPRYHPPLFRQRRQRDFKGKDVLFGVNLVCASCSPPAQHLDDLWAAQDEDQPCAGDEVGSDIKQQEILGQHRPIKLARDNCR